jgi:small subunit ribosomal protein S23
LHLYHTVPLSQAYRTACQQYAALRSEHTIASHAAYLEAKAYGATFSTSASAIRRGYDLEEKALERWGKDKDQDINELVARKKWRVVVDKSPEDVGTWTGGRVYAQKVASGERPTYKIGRVDSWTSVLPDGARVDRSSPIEEEDEELGR